MIDDFFQQQNEQHKKNLESMMSSNKGPDRVNHYPLIQTIKDAANVLINTIFSVRVQNLPDTQKVVITNTSDLKPQVTVTNVNKMDEPVKIKGPIEASITNLGDLIAFIKPLIQKEIVNKVSFPKELDVNVKNQITIPKYPTFPKSIEVSNFPKHEKVNLNPILEAMKVLNDSLYEIRLSIEQKLSSGGSGGNVVVATTTGSYKEQLPGIIKYDPHSTNPTYIGTNPDPSATDSDPNWTIIKHTYHDTETTSETQSVTRKGAWANRASLF